MPPTKRARPDTARSSSISPKRPRGSITVGSTRLGGQSIKADPDAASASSSASPKKSGTKELRERFISLFSDPEYASSGVPNGALKSKFGDDTYTQLVPIINDLMRKGKISMHKFGGELIYSLLSDEVAAKFAGLDSSHRMVYQVVERAGNKGIWTRDIQNQTNIESKSLTKIYKELEKRRLIKPVKSVTAKTKRLYILFDIIPAKEITGGPWYTELEFDHEFISELRTFVLRCVSKLNGGKGITLAEIAANLTKANISRVKLNLEEVQQLLQTLAFDYRIEQGSVNMNGESLFVLSRPVSSMCEFTAWEVLSPDFQFRTIRFEDDVTLAPHEPHHHSA
uniref:DNA-directed RNA polymerase III subunit RPC6 n=2 Tax=Ditylum brightwellii TaxID=49249 RepID=A0A6U3W4Q6_9STRA|mmetsp:Transcript_2410/g.3771  ORF Transcript_2410/g.3771 Transcript_2410/m.3771 type:complete len:339 (+) Transcript_2410:163-1179(+)